MTGLNFTGNGNQGNKFERGVRKMSVKVRSPNREQVIAVLLSSASIRAAADSLGIHEKTLRRWKQCPEFSATLVERQRELSQALHHGIISRAQGAAAVLDGIMSDPENPPAARVQAARTLLDNAHKAVEVADILPRLEQLEAMQKEG